MSANLNDDGQIPRTYVSAPWPRRPKMARLLAPPGAKLAQNGGIPVCMVRAIVNDSVDGTPVAGATVTYRLSSYDVDDGYVAPLAAIVETDVFGEAFVLLWPNELGAVATYYEVKIVANGKTLRLTCAVPNVPEADLHLIAQLPPWPGQSQGSFVSSEVYEWMLRAEQAAQDAAQSAQDAQAAADAAGLEGAEVDENGHLIITRGDETEYDAGYVIGPEGPQGPAGVAGEAGAGASDDTQVLFNSAETVVGSPKFVYTDSQPRLTLFNTYTDASNNERLNLQFFGSVAYLQTLGAGTGVQRGLRLDAASIALQTAGATKWQVAGIGDFQAGGDNLYDIGAAGSFRPRTIYLATSAQVAGAVNAGYTQGVTTAGHISSYSGISPKARLQPEGLQLGNDVSVSWGATVNAGNNALQLWYDGAGALGQRSAATAQLYRPYNTYTDASNYERAEIGWSGGVLAFKAMAAGTGAGNRGVHFEGFRITMNVGTFGARFLSWRFAETGFLHPELDNTYDLGTVSNRVRSVYSYTTFATVAFKTDGGFGAGWTGGAPAAGEFISYTAGTNSKAKMSTVGISLATDVAIGWGTTANAGQNAAVLWSDAAHLLNMRNGVQPQRFTVYNTYTDASNYERVVLGWVSGEARVGVDVLGTGAVARPMALMSRLVYFRDPAQTNQPATTFDFGNKIWSFYGVVDATNWERLTINYSAGSPYISTSAGGTGVVQNLRIRGGTGARLYFGSDQADRWQIDLGGQLVPMATDTFNIGQTTLRISTVFVGTGGVNIMGGVLAGTTNAVELRNAGVSQNFNYYRTWTDASNYERCRSGFNSTVFEMVVEGAGTGSVTNTMRIGTAGTGAVYLRQNAVDRWHLQNGGSFAAVTDNTYDIGNAANFRPKDIFAAGKIVAAGQVQAATVRVTPTLTFATLPAANANEGGQAFISDGSLPAAGNYGAAAAGGGSNKVPVWSNGTAWFIG